MLLKIVLLILDQKNLIVRKQQVKSVIHQNAVYTSLKYIIGQFHRILRAPHMNQIHALQTFINRIDAFLAFPDMKRKNQDTLQCKQSCRTDCKEKKVTNKNLILQSLHLTSALLKAIADSVHGMDVLVSIPHFLPELFDNCIHCSHIAVIIKAPDTVQYVLAGHHLVFILDKEH